MLKITLSAVSASLLALTVNVDLAQAQSRVFVAAQGNDANPCTFALPCRTFQHAHDVVASAGEIDVLDPAGYGALTISKAISIQGHGFAGLAVPGGNGITISAGSTDKVNLRGLLLDGVGTGGHGIRFNSGASLNLQDCLIRNFGQYGILFVPSAPSKLSVSNTVISENANSALRAEPIGAGSVDGVFDHVEMHNNGESGLFIIGNSLTTGTIKFTLSDSVAANNGDHGVQVASNTAATALIVRNSTIFNNVNNGLFTNGGAGIIRVTHSTITGNAIGFEVSQGALESFGDNALRGNTTDGAPTSTVPLK